MNKEDIYKQFIYTLEDDIKNKTFLTYEEENEWKDYLERIINSQTNKYKIVLDKIKEIVNEMPYLWYADEEIERIDGTIELKYKEYDTLKLEELLEEIE